jgi:hypothetical protein
MKSNTLRLIVLATVSLGTSVVALGDPIPTIQFPDGKVLNVVGTVGSGPNAAYLDVDFSNNTPAGPAFAWQFNWSGSATASDMLNAVAAADSQFTVVWDSAYAGFIDNFNYGGNIGAADPFAADNFSYWSSYIGTYDSKDATYASTQNINWVYAPSGANALTLGDLYDGDGNLLGSGVQGLFYGWTINGEYQTSNLTPNLPEVAVPEPACVGWVGAPAVALLARRRRA